jgi:hypothetical protein
MAYKRKFWKEKLEDNKKFPKILKFDPKFPCGKSLEKMGARKGDLTAHFTGKNILEK